MPNDTNAHGAGRSEVLAVTSTVLGTSADEAEMKAQKRGWLDENGDVTADGQSMIDAYSEQSGTRSVFR